MRSGSLGLPPPRRIASSLTDTISAFLHFAFRQPLMMTKLSKRKHSTNTTVRALPSGDPWHHDIMAYLGGMNTSLALLAILRLYTILRPNKYLSTGTAAGDVPLDVLSLTVLGLANFSQAFMNFATAAGSDRWIMGKGLDRITVLDALFTVLDWAAVVGQLR
ncbi:hypothetical protein S40285_10578 [Stachybotrys chlorohalonatus IBT 40285]|uniref:Uncharacterized protein n=1 Tax=Stachybotrys chlorohalonatus (strain IBT 40285) TaxID=1283841 RepID=A0A084Q8H0_STAC4|nr:hypothetical protein S40285_10578 [Stachybotrys chlorohalonata IBT 40285]